MTSRKYPQKKYLAAQLLASGYTVTDTAESVGITRKTLAAWRKLDEFQELIREAQDEMLQAISRKYLSATELALDVAMSVLQDEDERANAKLRAAELVMRYALELWAQNELAERVARLEERFRL